QVDTTGMERMTAAEPAERQPAAPRETVSLDGLLGVARAGGMEAALPAEVGAQRELIQADCRQYATFRQISNVHLLELTCHRPARRLARAGARAGLPSTRGSLHSRRCRSPERRCPSAEGRRGGGGTSRAAPAGPGFARGHGAVRAYRPR